MSVVVVVKKNGKAVIAADTLSMFGRIKVSPTYIRCSKIHRVNGTYLGLVGASVHANVFEHIIEKESEILNFNDENSIFDTYLKLHAILKEKYFLNPNENDDDEYESSQIDGLIANSNGIFGMYSLREVYEFQKFWAIGSGDDFAIGAMHTAYELFDEPEKIAEIGVNAACEFDDGCGLPMDIYSVELSNNE